jgi:hypothetical protein
MLVGYITLWGQQVFNELRREARELVIEDEALCRVGLMLRYPRSDSFGTSRHLSFYVFEQLEE